MTAADLSTARTPTGMPPAVRSAIIWTLTDLGFPRDQAEAWANGWSCRPDPAMVAQQAIAFDDHGVPIDQAVAWHQHGFYTYEACPLYDARWTPSAAATARDLTWDTGTELDDWVATGLPADRVIAYLRANVGVNETAAFEARQSETVGVLMMLAALQT